MYDNEVSSPASQVPAITSAADNLTRANGRLSESLAQLAGRLSPVLREELTDAGSDDCKEPAYSSPLARAIQNEAIFVRNLADIIDSLIARLEV